MSELSEWEKGARALNEFLLRFIREGRAQVRGGELAKWNADTAILEPLLREARTVLEREIAKDYHGGNSPLYRLHDAMIDLAEPWIRNFPDPWRDDFRDALDGIDMYPGYDEDEPLADEGRN